MKKRSVRHTWASWHVQRDAPLYVLKELGGWETMTMVQRYAHSSSGHLIQWVQPHTTPLRHYRHIECCLKKLRLSCTGF